MTKKSMILAVFERIFRSAVVYESGDTFWRKPTASLVVFARTLTEFVSYVFRCFLEDKCPRAAASLAYVTLLSLVPLLTVIFITLSAFPAFSSWVDVVEAFIFENFVPALGTQIREYILQFSENAKTLQAAGTIFLLITVLMMMSTIESTFNVIWGVRRKRPLVIRFMLYWSLLTLGPILLGAGMVATSYIVTSKFFSIHSTETFLSTGFFSVFPLIANSVAFFLFFKLIPFRPVPFFHAFVGGVLAGVLFELAKEIFAYYIEYFPSQQVVYGAFAGVPLFLFWVYLSWTIILLGAEITKCFGTFRFAFSVGAKITGESQKLFCAYGILVLLYDAQNGIGGLSEKQLVNSDLRFSYETVNDCLGRLDAAGWISRNQDFSWALTRDLNRTSSFDLVQLFPTVDISSESKFLDLNPADGKFIASMYEFSVNAREQLDIPIVSLLKHKNQ